MEIRDKIKEISKLNDKLERLESFAKEIIDNDLVSGVRGNLFYQIETTKRINILSRFNFNTGVRLESISIPNDLNIPIKKLVIQEIELIRGQLNLMLNGTEIKK